MEAMNERDMDQRAESIGSPFLVVQWKWDMELFSSSPF